MIRVARASLSCSALFISCNKAFSFTFSSSLLFPLLNFVQRNLNLQSCSVQSKRFLGVSSSIDMATLQNASISTQKQAVRKQVRARLNQLSVDEIKEQSALVWQRLFALPQYQEAKSIGLFLSMPRSEISTEKVCKDALSNNKTIYVPEVGSNFEHANMDLIKVILNNSDSNTTTYNTENDRRDETSLLPFYHDWPRNKWSIPEPPNNMPRIAAQPGDLDLIVVPGLAFDRQGNRLGQGKGYYDRFLQRIITPNVKAPLLVAVCLECQLVDHVPTHSFDQTVDYLLMPNETLCFRKST